MLGWYVATPLKMPGNWSLSGVLGVKSLVGTLGDMGIFQVKKGGNERIWKYTFPFGSEEGFRESKMISRDL